MRMFEHVVLVMLSRYLAAKTFKSIQMFYKCLKANFIPPTPPRSVILWAYTNVS